MIFVSFRFLWGKEKRFTPDLKFRGEAATLHGSTLLTEKNPSLVTSVTGGPGAAYWGISFLPRGSKAVSQSRKPKTLAPCEPLSASRNGWDISFSMPVT